MYPGDERASGTTGLGKSAFEYPLGRPVSEGPPEACLMLSSSPGSTLGCGPLLVRCVAPAVAGQGACRRCLAPSGGRVRSLSPRVQHVSTRVDLAATV